MGARPSFAQRPYGSSFTGSYDDRYAQPTYAPQQTYPSPDYRGRPYR